MVKSELLQITIPLFVLAIVLFSILAARIKPMKSEKRKTLFYVLISGLIFGLVGLVGFLEGYLYFYVVFFISGVYFLGVGILNQLFIKYFLPWYHDLNFLFGLFFNIIIAALGVIFYMCIYFYIAQMGVNKFHLFNVVFYFLPFLISRSVDYYFNIPKPEYKKWFYPFGEMDDPTENEMASPLVISFEFQKKFDFAEITTFRAKAPKYMKLGKLFYYFIIDYNTKNSESKIEYIYEKSKPYGWVFYIKPTWIGRRIYIDPEKTIADNSIEEDSVIICHRVFE